MPERLRGAAAALACAVVIGVVAGPARATVTTPLDLRDLVSSAETVVYGRVVHTRALDTRTGAVTVVTVGMTAYLKGEGGRTIDFQVPGGQVGRYRTVVVGAPVVEVGDEAVVFLTEARAGRPAVVGFSQGFVRVVRASNGAAPMVLAPPYATDDGPVRVVRGGPARRFVPLAAFAEDVRALTAESPSGQTPRRRGTRALSEGR